MVVLWRSSSRWPLSTVVVVTALVAVFIAEAVGAASRACAQAPVTEGHYEHRSRLRRGKERLLRNWHEPLPDGVKRQLDQAANYFSNLVRVPAALIAGQASSVLFKLTDLPHKGRVDDATLDLRASSPSRAKAYVTLWRLHILLMGYTVCSELTAVLLCFTAHAQILDISRDEFALEPTALDLINRHVEFEYLTVRFAFFSGLVVFLLAIAACVFAALAAAPKGSALTLQRELFLSIALGLMLASALCWWASICLEDMLSFMEIKNLFRRFCRLLQFKLKDSPFAIFSMLFAAVSVGFSTAALSSNRSPTMRRISSHGFRRAAASTGGATEEIEDG